MTSFVFIFSRTHAQTRTRVARYATAEAAEPACSFTDLLVPLRTRTSIITLIFYESNQTKDVRSEVGRGGRGAGVSRTAHCGLRITASELRNQNRNRIQHQNQSFQIISTNYQKVQIESDKTRQIVGQSGGAFPECSARTSACQHEPEPTQY